jgi:hypothetical protein
MMTGAEVAREISERTGIPQVDVKHVLSELGDVAREEIQQVHRFRIGNLVQIEPKVKAAIKKGTMKMNPSIGEMQPHPGKPAEARIAVRALAGIKSGDHLPSVQKIKRANSK